MLTPTASPTLRGRDGRSGEERLRAALRGDRGDSPTQMLTGLDEALQAFGVGARPDDSAMIALRRQPSAGGGDCAARLPGTGLSTAAT